MHQLCGRGVDAGNGRRGYLALKSKYASTSRAMSTDLKEELSRIAFLIRIPEQDLYGYLVRTARSIDDLDNLDEKVPENRKLGIVLTEFTDNCVQ